jgi:outer membrane protein OmpA-like peptidoglycan-associated protein
MFERQTGLADLVLALAAAPGARVRLEGFVDTGTSEKDDLHASMELARAAGRRLIELGVPRDRVTWAGRGREAPIAPGFTAKGRMANRRVEVVPLEDAR